MSPISRKDARKKQSRWVYLIFDGGSEKNGAGEFLGRKKRPEVFSVGKRAGGFFFFARDLTYFLRKETEERTRGAEKETSEQCRLRTNSVGCTPKSSKRNRTGTCFQVFLHPSPHSFPSSFAHPSPFALIFALLPSLLRFFTPSLLGDVLTVP